MSLRPHFRHYHIYCRSLTSLIVLFSTANPTFGIMNNGNHSSALEQAHTLVAPPATSMEKAETEGALWWEEHSSLLKEAWKEWENQQEESLSMKQFVLNDLLDPAVHRALTAAWNHPERHEQQVRELWTTAVPGHVYQAQILRPDQIHRLRAWLDASTSTANIPTRRPNAMNRYGVILEPGVDGAVGVSVLNQFCADLVQELVRPVGRMLFDEFFSSQELENDEEWYAFTIRYKQGEDLDLREHSDASIVTLNINLNLPGEEAGYEPDANSGDEPCLYFVRDGERQNVTFAPGMAVLHRGLTRHGAFPIQHGQRTNLVVWLFGRGGYVRIMPYDQSEQMTARERWQRQPVSRVNDHNTRLGELMSEL